MTYGEYFNAKGFKTEDEIKDFLKKRGWWSEYFIATISNYINNRIFNFDVFCDYPFWKVNKIYNSYYEKDESIGSTYDWLEEIATDEIVEKYLGKENEELN